MQVQVAGIQQIDTPLPIALVGGGGHAVSLCGTEAAIAPSAYVDYQESASLPISYLGTDSALLGNPDAPAQWRVHIAFVGIGAQALGRRRAIINRYSSFTPATIIASDASVAPGSDIAPGCAVLRRAVVNNARLGEHTVVNTGALIEHGCSIGSNCFIGPGAVVCGEVTVGSDTFIGAGAVIRNGVTIPSATTIGMGAVVTESLPASGTYVGNPARLISTPAPAAPPVIIAEAGVNHGGSLATAIEMVHAAAEAGADYVKFQTFKASNLVTATADRANYQKENCGTDETQLQMLKHLELTAADFNRLSSECAVCGIGFLSTPFDLESVDTLAPLGMHYWKIPSGEITNLPLLRKIGALGQHVIMSTGMSTLDEVEAAVALLESSGTPRKQITLLHCNTQYPTDPGDVNLRAMDSLRLLGCASVGYSDHTRGIDIPLAAAALGASVIEKHFTLDRNLPGPDHKASLEPHELKQMVQGIRNITAALGSAQKCVTDSEQPNKTVARKSIVAARAISVGELFSDENLTAKRPGNGISPMLWQSLIGRPASKAYARDELIDKAEL